MTHSNQNPNMVTAEFRRLSARLGADPLQIQGPGGNTSIKHLGIMWIKASGTELKNAENNDIFVAVNRNQAVEEAFGHSGDGSCQNTVINKSLNLRPSIETTFHATLEFEVVVHTHSVVTIAHSISPQGRQVLTEKLQGLPFVMVPYAKPGLPLTHAILKRIHPDTQVIILQNHGLLCCGQTPGEVEKLIGEVERRLAIKPRETGRISFNSECEKNFYWAEESWMARDAHTAELVVSGSYYPDHVVFLGPALPCSDHSSSFPAILKPGEGIMLRTDASANQKAMLRCLSDVMKRLDPSWEVESIGAEAEQELLNWDAEKYRQTLSISR